MSTENHELRLLAAQAAGLSDGLAARLRGDNLAALTADAESLAALRGAPTGPPQTLDGGIRRSAAGGRGGWTKDSVRDLARRDPRKFNELVDNGTINLAAL